MPSLPAFVATVAAATGGIVGSADSAVGGLLFVLSLSWFPLPVVVCWEVEEENKEVEDKGDEVVVVMMLVVEREGTVLCCVERLLPLGTVVAVTMPRGREEAA